MTKIIVQGDFISFLKMRQCENFAAFNAQN